VLLGPYFKKKKKKKKKFLVIKNFCGLGFWGGGGGFHFPFSLQVPPAEIFMAEYVIPLINSAAASSAAGAAFKFVTGDSKGRKRMRGTGVNTRQTKGYPSSRFSTARKLGIRAAGIRSLIPKQAHSYLVSSGYMAIPAACAKRNAGEAYLFDVTWNSLTTPWAMTASYDNGGMAVRQSTPTSAALGYQGLSQLLGNGKSYDSYCCDSATLELWVTLNNVADQGSLCVVPIKYFQGAFDGSIPVHLQDGARSAGARTKACTVYDSVNYLRVRESISHLFGVPKTACSIDPNFGARYTTFPANYAQWRILYNPGNDNVAAGEIQIRFKLTVKAKLFNADNTAISDAVV